MQRRYAGFAIFGLVLFGNDVSARPKVYSLTELVEQAPLIVTGRVTERMEGLARVVVEHVVKGGHLPPAMHFQDSKGNLEAPGLRLGLGDQVMLFLNTPDELFTSDHLSKLDIMGSDRIVEMIEAYLSAAGTKQMAAKHATIVFLEAVDDYQVLSTLERRFLLQVIGRRIVDVSKATIDHVIESGMTDGTPEVRWEGFAAASRLDLVLEKKLEFVRGLRDAEWRVRAVSFASLHEKTGNTFGYDPNLRTEQQVKALEDWQSWATRE
jgi:hypothetical protein